jgi:hypothetical protein
MRVPYAGMHISDIWAVDVFQDFPVEDDALRATCIISCVIFSLLVRS